MRILLATSNPHKLEEIQAVFDAQRAAAPRHAPAITLLTLADLGLAIPEPHEDQPTFEGNAVLKARHYAKASDMLCLADDSGLEVDALGGEPGVRSARYAGVSGPRSVVDPANNMLLLEKLRGVPLERRSGRFVCAMALVAPGRGDQILAQARGTVEGRIITPDQAADQAEPHCGRGTNGFGYDPLFLIDAVGKTTAELDPPHKNAISHRGRAAR